MRNINFELLSRIIPGIFLGLMCTIPDSLLAAPSEDGKRLVMDVRKGNCLACHDIDGGKLPGNLGPPLINMQTRFPDKNILRAQIWDSTQKNPNSRMPPFGKHGILTGDEIDAIVDYLYTL